MLPKLKYKSRAKHALADLKRKVKSQSLSNLENYIRELEERNEYLERQQQEKEWDDRWKDRPIC